MKHKYMTLSLVSLSFLVIVFAIALDTEPKTISAAQIDPNIAEIVWSK